MAVQEMAAGAAGSRGIHRTGSPGILRGCLSGILPARRGSRPTGDTAVVKSFNGGGNRGGARAVVVKSHGGGNRLGAPTAVVKSFNGAAGR
ncbi:hypothetical protein ACFVTM_02880 [Arthrobacter sp. NPDC058130]|uniref:hypothetical protein n=1 Tax=Arthrobacter sp. NPDC058130 TaxID=3346353 RepID=UPI0036EB5D89